MTPIVSLGIDPSATATGLIALRSNGEKVADLMLAQEIVPKKLTGMARVRYIATNVMSVVHLIKPDVIVVEGYSLNMKNANSVVPLVEVGGVLRLMLHLDELEWLDPRAPVLKEFITGKGNSAKNIVMMNVFKRWGYEAPTDNLADAYGLACLGLAHRNRLPGITERMRIIAGELKPTRN